MAGCAYPHPVTRWGIRRHLDNDRPVFYAYVTIALPLAKLKHKRQSSGLMRQPKVS